MGKKKFHKKPEGDDSGEKKQPSHQPQQQAGASTSGTHPPAQGGKQQQRGPPGHDQGARGQPQKGQQQQGGPFGHDQGGRGQPQGGQRGPQDQRPPPESDQGKGPSQAWRQPQEGQQHQRGPPKHDQGGRGPQQQKGHSGHGSDGRGQQQQRGPPGGQQQGFPQGGQPQGQSQTWQQQQISPQEQQQGRDQPQVWQQQQGPPQGQQQGRGQPQVWQQQQGPPQGQQQGRGQPQVWQQQGQQQQQGRGQQPQDRQQQQQGRGQQPQDRQLQQQQGRGQQPQDRQQQQPQDRQQQQKGRDEAQAWRQQGQQQRGPPSGFEQVSSQSQQAQGDFEEPVKPTSVPTQPPKKDQTGQGSGDHRKPGPSKQTSSKPPEASSKGSKLDVTGLELAIPQRKKLNTAGTEGRRIRIETNHLLLTLKNLKVAYHYDVTIDPDTPKKLLRHAVESFRLKHYPKNYPAFDGKKNLYSAKELPIQLPYTDEVTVKDDDRDRKYKVTVKYAATVDLTAVSRYFEAVTTNRHLVTPQDAIQCLDIVLRSAPSLNCIPVGRSFFTIPRGNIIDLGDGMEMYNGYYQSAVLGWKPFLNVDVSHKAFPKSWKVLDIIEELCPQHRFSDPMNFYDRDTLNKFLRTLKVQYEIPNLPATKRVMRINELDKSANEAKFKNDAGKVLTVVQYFQDEKRFKLRFPNLPCLWVGSKQREQRILLPAELCTLVPGQVTNRAMTPLQTSNMIKHAATSTSVRKDKIMQSVRQARYNDDPSVCEFGLSVSSDFAQIDARVLEPPMIRYNQRQEKPNKGVWRAGRFLTGMPLGSDWAIISVDNRTNDNTLKEFSTMLVRAARDKGMEVGEPRHLSSYRLPPKNEKGKLEEIFRNLKGFRLVVVVIPTDYKDIYNYVKQVAELIVGTLTQCVKGRNVFRPKPATVDNILLKINAKLNGINHVLGVKPKILETPCMIMGADVTHPSPENRGTVPSVAAVTASHDPNAFQYNICWRLQPPTQEIIADLANIMGEHLMYFYDKNRGRKPEKIIFFRDGVSEGQFEIVLNSEVMAIRQACSKMGDGSYKPKITFLVVQKRHHTRFFPMNPRDSEDRNMNVPAGTVVDTEITHPTALDFYLVSHASIQGVARPTKYRMLWDDNDMNEDELERLTYHLCHLFTRCTRSVSYPAPTYYAHLAAARAKVYCERKILNMDDLQREFRSLTIKEDIVKQLPMFFV